MTDLARYGLVPLSSLDGGWLARAARGIPLYQAGGVLRAFAIVDADDYRVLVGERWHVNTKGYAAYRERGSGRIVRMHRRLIGLLNGDRRQVDHINRDKLDNRRANLRVATNALNHQNLPSYRGSTSRHRGVFWDRHRGRWAAAVTLSGRRYSLGRFDDELHAAEAAAAWRREHMPYAMD